MTVLNPVQLIPCVDALPIVNQDQICRVETVVTIDLHKKIRGDIQARLEQRRALVKHLQPTEVCPNFNLLMQNDEQVSDAHGC